MKLSLSNVLELADATKGNFDARRARELLTFFPLNAGAAAELDPMTPGISPNNPTPSINESDTRSRRRYSVADAVAIDLFERANAHSRIENKIVDAAIANNARFIETAVLGADLLFETPDLYIGVALYEPEGRWHFDGGTLAQVEAQIPKFHDRKGPKDPISEIVLLNVSAAHRRVLERMHQGFRAGKVSNVFKDAGE